MKMNKTNLDFFDVKDNIFNLTEIFFVCNKEELRKLPTIRKIHTDLTEYFKMNTIILNNKRSIQFMIINISNIIRVIDRDLPHRTRKTTQFKSGINIQVHYFALNNTYLQPLIYLRSYIKNHFKFDSVKMFVSEEIKGEN